MVDRLTERIEEAIAPFRSARDVLVTIPGVSVRIADVIIAETGADMTAFATAAHLASWAGVCPGQNESAGKMKSSHTTHGNKYLKGALGVAALSVSQSKGTFLAARYRRLVTRRGKPRAIVAIQHSILTAVWHMLRNGEAYDELGADYYTQRDPQRTRNRAIRDLESLGYDVVITPAAA
jgi:transposase